MNFFLLSTPTCHTSKIAFWNVDCRRHRLGGYTNSNSSFMHIRHPLVNLVKVSMGIDKKLKCHKIPMNLKFFFCVCVGLGLVGSFSMYTFIIT